MKRFQSALMATMPVAAPILITMLVFWLFDKSDEFGSKTDISLFSMALGFEALYASYKASQFKAPKVVPTWLLVPFLMAGISIGISILVFLATIAHEFKSLDFAMSRGLAHLALLNLLILVFSLCSAVTAEYAASE